MIVLLIFLVRLCASQSLNCPTVNYFQGTYICGLYFPIRFYRTNQVNGLLGGKQSHCSNLRHNCPTHQCHRGDNHGLSERYE